MLRANRQRPRPQDQQAHLSCFVTMVVRRSMSISAKAAASVVREATVPTLASATSLHAPCVFARVTRAHASLTLRQPSTLSGIDQHVRDDLACMQLLVPGYHPHCRVRNGVRCGEQNTHHCFKVV